MEGNEVLERIGRAFRDQTAEEIEEAVAEAVAEARGEERRAVEGQPWGRAIRVVADEFVLAL